MIKKYSYILFISLISVLFISFLLIPQVYAERGIEVRANLEKASGNTIVLEGHLQVNVNVSSARVISFLLRAADKSV